MVRFHKVLKKYFYDPTFSSFRPVKLYKTYSRIMKHIKIKQVLPALLLLVGMYACQKELSGSVSANSAKFNGSSPDSLILSDTTAYLGQAITASLPTGLTKNNATWSVRPAAVVQISSSGQSATFTFSSAGTYTIIAHYIVDSVAGTQDSLSAPVRIIDSTAHSSADSISLAGQNLILIPTSVDTGVTFTIETANAFPCYYSLPVTQNVYPRGNQIFLGDLTAQSPSTCNGTVRATGSFTIEQVPPGSTGSFDLFVGSAGVYTINVANTDTGYVFSQSYLNGGSVIISPTTLKH
jgi:hypothetical protein